MKIIRKIIISLIICALSFFTYIQVNHVNASNIVLSNDIELMGAGVRTTGEHQGMRFGVNVTNYNNLNNVTKYGVLIAYGTLGENDNLVKNGSNINDHSIIYGEIDSLDDNTENNKAYYITLYNIPSSSYEQIVSVRAYVVLSDSSICYSSNIIARNLVDTARNAYNSNSSYDNSESLVYQVVSSRTVKITSEDGSIHYSNINNMNYQSGDIINICRGNYQDISFSKQNLTIEGTYKDVEDYNLRNDDFETFFNCVSIQADNITLNGICTAQVSLASDTINSSSSLKGINIENCNISSSNNQKYGIEASLSSVVLEDIRIQNNLLCYQGTSDHVAIRFISSVKSIQIKDNYFNAIEESSMNDDSYGILINKYENESDIDIKNNTFDDLSCNYVITIGETNGTDSDNTSKTNINIENNNFVSSSNKVLKGNGLKICGLVDDSNVDVIHNMIHTSSYYNGIVISTGVSGASSLEKYPTVALRYNMFYASGAGITKPASRASAISTPYFRIGLGVPANNTTHTVVTIDSNYYGDGVNSSRNTYDSNSSASAVNPNNTINLKVPYVSTTSGADSAYNTYSNKKAFQEIIVNYAYSYYYQGNQIQYDMKIGRRNMYATPNQATSYRGIYLDCSSYVNSIYKNVLGIDVISSASGTNVSTSTINTYAKNNTTKADVIAYVETKDYTTDDERASKLSEVRNSLEIGDILCYRHGASSGSSGHVMIYIGNDLFLHCTGSSFSANATNPTSATDGAGTVEKTQGAILTLDANLLFTKSTNKRYLFNEGTDGSKTDTSMKVWSFEVIRPFNRTSYEVQNQAINHLSIPGVTIEKTSVKANMSTVSVQDKITYNITLTNNTDKNVYGINVQDQLDANVTIVNGSINHNGIYDGEKVQWDGITLYANSSMTYSYTLKVNNNVPSGTIINSDKATVNNVNINKIYHSVGCEIDETKLLSNIDVNRTYSDWRDFVYAAYEDIIGETKLDDYLISEKLVYNLAYNGLDETHAAYDMVVPGFYGGLNAGFYDDDMIRLVKNDYLEMGDIILTRYEDSDGNKIYGYYLYIDENTIYSYTDSGITNIVTTSFTSDKFLMQLIGYKVFVVLRPALVQ